MKRASHFPPIGLERSCDHRRWPAKFAALFLGLGLLASGLPGQAALRPDSDRLFARMDTDHNGGISEQEWHAAMQRRFERLDANHDGVISREEMAAARDQLRAAARGRRDGGLAGN